MALRFRIRPPDGVGGLAAVERAIDVEPTGGAVTFGRRSGVDIQLPFGTVSGVHVRVSGGPGRWIVEDLGSANGTFLVVGGRGDEARDSTGRRLVAGQPSPLAEGDVLRLADVTVVFEGVAAEPVRTSGAATESTATLARRLVSDFFGACRPAEVACLIVENGPEAGTSLTLVTIGRTYRVGRATGCDLVVTDDDVSREHASFQRRWDAVYVEDLGSKNGVELDGERLAGAHPLHDGDTVVLGATRIRLDDPEDRYLAHMQDEEGRRTILEARGGAAPTKTPVSRVAPVPAPATASPSSPLPVEPARRGGRGPVLIATVAVLVLLGIGLLVGWFLVGDWK